MMIHFYTSLDDDSFIRMQDAFQWTRRLLLFSIKETTNEYVVLYYGTPLNYSESKRERSPMSLSGTK
jgi:hypothetical protein